MSNPGNDRPPSSPPWSPRSGAALAAARASNNPRIRDQAEHIRQTRQRLDALARVVHEEERQQEFIGSVVRLSGAATEFRPRAIAPMPPLLPYDQVQQRLQQQQSTPQRLPYHAGAPTNLSVNAAPFQIHPIAPTRQLWDQQQQQQHQRSLQPPSFHPTAPPFVPGVTPAGQPRQAAPLPPAPLLSTQQQPPPEANIGSSIQGHREMLNRLFTRIEAWARTYAVLPLPTTGDMSRLATLLHPVHNNKEVWREYMRSSSSRPLLLAAMINRHLFEVCFRPEIFEHFGNGNLNKNIQFHLNEFAKLGPGNNERRHFHMVKVVQACNTPDPTSPGYQQWLGKEVWRLLNELMVAMTPLIATKRRAEAASTLNSIISDMHELARRVRGEPRQWLPVFPSRGSPVTPRMTERNQRVVGVASAAPMRAILFVVTPIVTLRWPREKGWEVESVVDASVVGEVKI